eukprot:COSAG01_NODE_43321_length_431_cov_0.536145_2_plen_87_part_01
MHRKRYVAVLGQRCITRSGRCAPFQGASSVSQILILGDDSAVGRLPLREEAKLKPRLNAPIEMVVTPDPQKRCVCGVICLISLAFFL